jgi:Mitochondrial pyruvate carriers
MLSSSSRCFAVATLRRSRVPARRWLSESTTKEVATEQIPKKKSGWWHSAELWGGLGAMAGWGMSGSAIYDATQQGPEVISLTMTPVLIVYSTLFARWAWIIQPRNVLLASCHVANVLAQGNQMRRALEYKIASGQEQEVREMGQKAAMGGAAIALAVVAGPTLQAALTSANLGVVSTVAAADAGPFTVHFWAPMSKWLISGASFLDLHRPTDKISLAQYTALTLTGFFFSRYSLLVIPINYTLCSVNIALFGSSFWHLGRKINADYLQIGMEQEEQSNDAEEVKGE